MIKMAKFTKSFYQWCIDNKREDLLNSWDYDLNKCTPKDVPCGSHKKYFFKCERRLHDSEDKMIYKLINGKINLKCNSCNSFGQYLIDTYGENGVEKLWDCEKNGKLDPFKIPKSCKKKVWLKCQEDKTHGSYLIRCNDFNLGSSRCPICK